MNESRQHSAPRKSKRVCPHCEAPVRLSERYCNACGKLVSESEDPRLGATLGDRYEVHERIGEGGMAVIYRATDLRSGQEVALKILDSSATRDPKAEVRFKAEGEHSSNIRHPGSVAVHDVGRFEDGSLYLSLELLRGEPLGKILAEQGAMEPSRVLTLMRQIAGAIGEAHRQGLVHRDLNPSNIMIVPARTDGGRERAVVIDYGIAIEAHRGVSERVAPDRLGTTLYASPEQIEGEALDARSDVYSLGVVMFQMLAGRHPTEMAAETLADDGGPTSRVLDTEELTAIFAAAGLAESLEKIIVNTMLPDRTQRYADARRLLHELEKIGAEPGTRRRAKGPTPQEQKVQRAKREKRQMAALIVTLVSAGILVLLGLLLQSI